MRILSIASLCAALALTAGAVSPTPYPVTDTLQPGGIYNALTTDAPMDVPLADLGLIEAGIIGAALFKDADEIRIFASKKDTDSSPLARIWVNTAEGGTFWFHTGGEGNASDFIIRKGMMVIVFTRALKEPVAWENIFHTQRPNPNADVTEDLSQPIPSG